MSGLVTKQAPDFTATAVLGDDSFHADFTLSSLRGKYVILFFYPLDFTFVCPTEILAFDEALEEAEKTLAYAREHGNLHYQAEIQRWAIPICARR